MRIEDELQRRREQRFLGSSPRQLPLVPAISAARWMLVLLGAAAVYFFHGFLVPVLGALVIGFASWPLHSKLVRATGGRETLAACLSLAAVVALLVVPMVFASLYALDEARQWTAWALHVNRDGEAAPRWIAALPLAGEWAAERWNETLGKPGVLGILSEAVSGETISDAYRMALAAGTSLVGLLLNLVFLLVALFFVYKDGATFAEQIDRLGERILPTRWQSFSRMVPATVAATATGMGLIALGEGLVLGTAYWVAGVPSPVLLGVVTAGMALVPGGAPLMFTLVSLYLVGSGAPGAGLALFLWGSVELFVVDKTLRPRLVGGPVKLPFLPTFFGLIGGVKTMGLVGLFVGPVLMALVVAIWREWMRELRTVEDEPVASVAQDRRVVDKEERPAA